MVHASHHPVPTSHFRRPLGVRDIFAIGIGPSSSHTVGPMRAAKLFVDRLSPDGLGQTTRISVEFFGSLSLTGHGHQTDVAVLAGLSGLTPEDADPDHVKGLMDRVRRQRSISIAKRSVEFLIERDITFHQSFHAGHANAVRFTAFAEYQRVASRLFFSIGGGEVVEEESSGPPPAAYECEPEPFPFSSAAELMAVATKEGCSIAAIVLANEAVRWPENEAVAYLDRIREAMLSCIERGCRGEGLLPGPLRVKRRARLMHQRLLPISDRSDPMHALDWVSLYALAVNEENADGGRVVTAPTNGAAGVIPAVLKYYETFCKAPTLDGSRTFLLTCAAIGILYKRRASVSAAEMGCQGEIGVACSMAAAGLTAALGGTAAQIEHAAEIGMEHNLGLTCDPVAGLVQIPCIERNTMGALKAINASRLALLGDGTHVVSLDAVIETMRQTGADMRSKYKETSLGGLAVNVVEC